MAIERIIDMIKQEQDGNRIDKDRLVAILLGMAEELGGALSGSVKGSSVAGPRGPPGPAGPAGPAGPVGPAGPACECKSKCAQGAAPKKTTTKKSSSKTAKSTAA